MLAIRNLTCHYGGIRALSGVSLSVDEGEMVALIGANGAGKTTLLSAICGLIPKFSGEMDFCGESIRGLSTQKITASGISMVPEGRLIFPSLTVKDHLTLGAYLRHRKKDRFGIETDIKKIYELFPVLEDRRKQSAGTLSGGEQQMLAIGRALMARPKLLLLDEPSMGLAPLVVRMIFSTLKQLKSEGLTIMLVEQNAQAALSLADRGYVLETGLLVLTGPARRLLADEEVKRAYLGKDYSAFTEGRA
ncbi:MAG: ABC transporter ATP-binding protein [Deltaproteobacteria bacterium]|nr:ABC transporter ATP-binding protein [Deltaproteobacteria bacterium]